MFDKNNRYVTCGISEKVSEELQQYIWMAVDLQKNFCKEELDYLQVFTFRKLDRDILAITQSQECPEKTTTHYIEYKQEHENLVNEKIFVIDDGDHSTMLFAYEY